MDKCGLNHRAKPKPLAPSPSKKTRWAYMMNGIEPTSDAINQAFPGYHPQWLQQSQKMPTTANGFKSLRKEMLRLTRKQCAAYLRVNVTTLGRWESGAIPVPFMAVELLRLILNSNSFSLSHPLWDGWFINPKDGCFVSPDRGKLDFTPDKLSYIPDIYRQKAIAESENAKLTADMAQLQAENDELRAMIAGGMIDELHSIRNQFEALVDKYGKAKVYQFPTNQPDQARKVAAA